ncbi:MAG: phosphoserine phosphatase SerB [Paludibacteraceae bacterium]|nr:phosphoserine phosphatase SerB [Paludibacteraceae bacterium]
MSHEIILISISGEDRPGVTASITQVLGKFNTTILDIGQANLHHQLSLGIMFRNDEPERTGDLLKEILFRTSELGVYVRFSPISDDDYNAWVGRQGKSRYVVTVLGHTLSAKQIALVTEAVSERGLNIDSIKRLTGRPPLNPTEDNQSRSCVEFSVRGDINNKEELSAQFMNISASEGIDISFQKDDMYRRQRRLICLDMDSTLTKSECIDELAEKAGVGEEVKKITAMAMRGEIDFKESFTRRVALLKGLSAEVLEEVAKNTPLQDGAERLLRVLKKCGFKIAVLSGGFTFAGKPLQERFGIDYLFANELEIKDGKLTGNYVGDIVDGKRKAELLRLIAQMEHIDLEQVIAVGDGANDLPMLGLAGLGIAFHAKPKVKATAKQSLSTLGLDGILYFLGFRDIHLESL